MSAPMIKTQVIDAMMAGADTTAKISRATGLASRPVSASLCHLRMSGVVEIAAQRAVSTGARQGHIWKLKAGAPDDAR